MPRPIRSSSSPSALVKAADPSASIVTLPSQPCSFPQAAITNASFTAMQATVSTPLALRASAFCTKLGRCLTLQVGVNAPGTANSTTFLPLKTSSVEVSLGPSGVAIISFMDGIGSPALIVMDLLAPLWLATPRLLPSPAASVTPPCFHLTGPLAPRLRRPQIQHHGPDANTCRWASLRLIPDRAVAYRDARDGRSAFRPKRHLSLCPYARGSDGPCAEPPAPAAQFRGPAAAARCGPAAPGA